MVQAEHVVRRGFEVAGGIVRRGDVAVVGTTILNGFQEIGDGVESKGRIRTEKQLNEARKNSNETRDQKPYLSKILPNKLKPGASSAMGSLVSTVVEAMAMYLPEDATLWAKLTMQT